MHFIKPRFLFNFLHELSVMSFTKSEDIFRKYTSMQPCCIAYINTIQEDD